MKLILYKYWAYPLSCIATTLTIRCTHYWIDVAGPHGGISRPNVNFSHSSTMGEIQDWPLLDGNSFT